MRNLRFERAQAERRFREAEKEYYAAEKAMKKARYEELQTTKCRRCGASPGNYTCGDADRIAFSCTNYVKDWQNA